MSTTPRTRLLVIAATLVVAAIGLAGPAAAFAPPAEDATKSAEELAPWPAAPEEAQRRVPADKPADEGGAEFIAPPPGDIVVEPIPAPPTTLPPKIDRAEFGIGWPAAAAVTIALLAVVAMAQMWRRDGA